MTLIGLGIVAVVMVWLVFSVLKKVIGFAFLIAIVIAGFMLWQNPAMLASLMDWVQGFFR